MYGKVNSYAWFTDRHFNFSIIEIIIIPRERPIKGRSFAQRKTQCPALPKDALRIRRLGIMQINRNNPIKPPVKRNSLIVQGEFRSIIDVVLRKVRGLHCLTIKTDKPRLQSWLYDAQGKDLDGTYFVYITKQ